MTHLIDPHIQRFLIGVARLCVWLLILSVIFVPLERLFSLHPQKVFRKAFFVDLGYYFLNSLLTGLLLSAPLAVIAWGARHVIPGGIPGTIAALPLWIRAVAALLVGEIGFYWGHRLTHVVPLLWQFHAIHHSAQQLDFLVNTRGHPVDIVFVRLCGLAPLYVLGLAGPAGAAGGIIPTLVILIGTMWGFFIHANLRWRLRPLESLIATPAFHHWHHTLNAPTNRNFAPMLPWVDRAFGTLYVPKGQWPSAYGIDGSMPESLSGQLLRPLRTEQPFNLA